MGLKSRLFSAAGLKPGSTSPWTHGIEPAHAAQFEARVFLIRAFARRREHVPRADEM